MRRVSGFRRDSVKRRYMRPSLNVGSYARNRYSQPVSRLERVTAYFVKGKGAMLANIALALVGLAMALYLTYSH